MAATQAVAPHLEFAPPPSGGFGRALVLALLIHAALIAALTWGVAWNRTQSASMQAEIWASVPVQAAPPEVPAPPPPPPPEPVAQKAKPAQAQTEDAEIVLERRRKEALEKKRLEAERREAERKREEERRKEEERKKAAEKKAAEKKAAEKKAEDERKRREQAEQKAEAAKREAEHQENVRRMQGLAGASGSPQSSGTARQSAGPSDSYGGRIVARVKPNIVFTDNVSGNPQAEVEVRAAPDGTIIGTRIVKSSGVKAWDDAVLKALDKTQVLPRDVDGRVPSPLLLVFRPRD